MLYLAATHKPLKHLLDCKPRKQFPKIIWQECLKRKFKTSKIVKNFILTKVLSIFKNATSVWKFVWSSPAKFTNVHNTSLPDKSSGSF